MVLPGVTPRTDSDHISIHKTTTYNGEPYQTLVLNFFFSIIIQNINFFFKRLKNVKRINVRNIVVVVRCTVPVGSCVVW